MRFIADGEKYGWDQVYIRFIRRNCSFAVHRIKYKKESTYDGKVYDSKVDFTSFETFIEEREGQITPEKYKKYHPCVNELKEWLSNSDLREDTYNDIYSDDN